MNSPSVSNFDDELKIVIVNLDEMGKILPLLDKLSQSPLSTVQEFNIAFYYRLLSYLTASTLAVQAKLWGPSRNLQRTCYEMILKGIYFLKNPEKAEEVRRKLDNDDEKAFDISITGKIIPNLYEGKDKEDQKKLYGTICPFSHADITGAILDFKDNLSQREDCVHMLCALEYGALDMLMNTLGDYQDPEIEKLRVSIVKGIQKCISEAPAFRPTSRVVN